MFDICTYCFFTLYSMNCGTVWPNSTLIWNAVSLMIIICKQDIISRAKPNWKQKLYPWKSATAKRGIPSCLGWKEVNPMQIALWLVERSNVLCIEPIREGVRKLAIIDRKCIRLCSSRGSQVMLQICDMIKQNQSKVSDIQFWVFCMILNYSSRDMIKCRFWKTMGNKRSCFL